MIASHVYRVHWRSLEPSPLYIYLHTISHEWIAKSIKDKSVDIALRFKFPCLHSAHIFRIWHEANAIYSFSLSFSFAIVRRKTTQSRSTNYLLWIQLKTFRIGRDGIPRFVVCFVQMWSGPSKTKRQTTNENMQNWIYMENGAQINCEIWIFWCFTFVPMPCDEVSKQRLQGIGHLNCINANAHNVNVAMTDVVAIDWAM